MKKKGREETNSWQTVHSITQIKQATRCNNQS